MRPLQRILDTLGRVTSRGKRFIPEIDGLRFLAIMPVVLLHLNTNTKRQMAGLLTVDPESFLLNTILIRGDFGVRLFFMISGFILALPFAKERLFGGKRTDLKYYYLRRVTRLEPPYVFTLFAFLLVRIFISGFTWDDSLPHFFASLFYVHNIVYGTWSTINPVAWSLEIEIQFYMLVPLLVTVFLIRRMLVRRAVIIAAIAVVSMLSFMLPLLEWHLQLSVLSDGHYFLMGFLLADLYLNDWRENDDRRSYLYDAMLAIGLIGVYVFDEMLAFTPVNRILFSISLFMAFVGVFRSRIANSFFRKQLVTVIGGMCYTIYLIHYPFIAFLGGQSWRLYVGTGYLVNVAIQVVVLAPIVLIVSAILFRMIEKPFMYPYWPNRIMDLAGRAWVALHGRSVSNVEPEAAVQSDAALVDRKRAGGG